MGQGPAAAAPAAGGGGGGGGSGGGGNDVVYVKQKGALAEHASLARLRELKEKAKVQERSRAEAYAAAQAAAPGPGVAELHAALRRHFSALGKEFEAKQISALRSLEGATTVVAASQRAVGFAQMRREEFRQLHAELDKLPEMAARLAALTDSVARVVASAEQLRLALPEARRPPPLDMQIGPPPPPAPPPPPPTLAPQPPPLQLPSPRPPPDASPPISPPNAPLSPSGSEGQGETPRLH